MKKFIEYAVKAILIVLVLLGYQALDRYADLQFGEIWWGVLSYAALILGHIACGMILAYNEHKSGKSGITKFVLVVIAIVLVLYVYDPFKLSFIAQNHAMMAELIRVLALIFGILLTGLKL